MPHIIYLFHGIVGNSTGNTVFPVQIEIQRKARKGRQSDRDGNMSPISDW